MGKEFISVVLEKIEEMEVLERPSQDLIICYKEDKYHVVCGEHLLVLASGSTKEKAMEEFKSL